MKGQSFRASRGRGWENSNQTKKKAREWYNESRVGVGTEFRQGLKIENGTTNPLLSLII